MILYFMVIINTDSPSKELNGIQAYIVVKQQSDESTGVMILAGVIFVLATAGVLILCDKVLSPKRSDSGYRKFLKIHHNQNNHH